MKVDDAKNLVKAHRMEVMTPIYESITKEASNGKTFVYVQCEPLVKKCVLPTYVVKILREDGYTASHYIGKDEQNGEKWDYIRVSWTT